MTQTNPNPRPNPDALLEHAPWLRRVALAVAGDPHSAEDVAQETWLAAMERGPRNREPGEADRGRTRSWLRTVVRRSASRQRQRDTANARRERTAARPEALPSTAELAEHAEMQQRLLDAIGRLDECTRRVILLRYFRGMSAVEIARADDEPSGTVRSRLKRGLDRLREELASDARDRRALLGFATAGAMPSVGPNAETPFEAASTTATAKTISSSLLPIGAGVALVATMVTIAIVLSTRTDREPTSSVSLETNAASAEPSVARIDVPPASDPRLDDLRGSALDGSTGSAANELADPTLPAGTSASTPSIVVRTVTPDGEPVAGVPVQLARRPGELATFPGPNAITDAAGEAHFPDLERGTYVPWIPQSADWFDVADTPWRIHEGPSEPTIEHDCTVTLVVEPTATLVVRLVDADGVLLEDCSMRLAHRWARGSGGIGLEAERIGDRLVVRGVAVFEAQTTTFVARHPGFDGEIEREVVLEPGRTHDLGTLVFERRLASVSGRVTTSDGRALAGAHVQITVDDRSERATTQDDGTFALHDLPHGTATLDLPDYRLRGDAVTFTLEAHDHHDLGRLVVDTPSRTLTGTVRVEGGAAIDRARVEFGPYRAEVASDGSFVLRGESLEPTALSVRARVPALGSGTLVARRDAITFDDAPVDLVVRPNGLVLELRDIETGRPIACERVSISGRRGIDLPADGRFGASYATGPNDAPGIVRFADPPAGPWSATITLRDYEPIEVAFEVGDGLDDREQRVVVEMYPIAGE